MCEARDGEGEFGYAAELTARSDQVLAELAAFGALSPDFAAEWARRVREGADTTCAQIAGQRMAGVTTGVATPGMLHVPVPDHGFDMTEVFTAFGLAVMREVAERFGNMASHSPGGLG